MTVKSSSCLSKWRASNKTVFSSSRLLLFSARSRKLPAMIVVPIVMAAIRNTPPRISQWIGLAPVECRTRNDAVLSAVIGLDRCPGYPEAGFLRPGPGHEYADGMEMTLGT